MEENPPVPLQTFSAIENVDIDALSLLSGQDLRPILPCLVRMSLCAPLDSSHKWTHERKQILKCLSGIEVVNNLVGLLSVDFHVLELDARKEQTLRLKMGNKQSESVLISQLEHSVTLEFEKTDPARKLRLLLSELLFVMSQIREPRSEFYFKSSELLENVVYLDEVSDVLCIAQAELPTLLSLPSVCEVLLHITNGSFLLCRLVANQPDSFLDVCESLVSLGEKQDEDNVGGEKRSEALQALCNMAPSHAVTVRNMCIEHCRMPALAVLLTLHHVTSDNKNGGSEDMLSFLTGLLLGNNSEATLWFSQYIKNSQKKKDSSLSLARKELLSQLQNLLTSGESSNQIAEDKVALACNFIKLYCALKGIGVVRFNEEESIALLQLITKHPPMCESGAQLVTLSLCMLLACPYLFGNHEQERAGIEWLRWLVAQAAHFESVSGGKSSFGEMLLLIAIHFHGNQNHAIADLVNSTLKIKHAVKTNSLARLKTILTQDVFTEQVVAAHAVKVAVTYNLNANMSGYLPVHCIYQLLKSRVFTRHKVPIKDWIFLQITACTTPIHPLIPQLIEAYINSVIIVSAKAEGTNQPISEREIVDVFKHSVLVQHMGSSRRKSSYHEIVDLKAVDTEHAQNSFTTQLLLLYYLLLYQDTLHSNLKTIESSGREVHRYSAQLWAQLPLKYLLQQAQKQQRQYAGLFSPLLRLLATHYPHLCMVEDWLDEDTAGSTEPLLPALPAHKCTLPALRQCFECGEEKRTKLLLQLEELSCLSGAELLPYSQVLIENMPQVLDSTVPRRLPNLMKTLWCKLNTVMPRKLRVLIANALRLQESGSAKQAPLTEDDLTADPLVLLKCDPRVLRCAPVLEVLLRVLEAYLQASKIHLISHAQVSSGEATPEATQEREQLRDALISAQESAVVQVLLELCMPQEQASLLSELREVQCSVCTYLHQKFIADPALVKLVHFQGYPSEVIPVAVAGIPSMHICLDFIPELIAQPHLDKQIFAIELVSHLSLQYALPKSLSVAKLAVSVMHTLLSVLSSTARVEFFSQTLASLERIARAFPPLCDDVISLLVQLGRVCTTQLSNSGFQIDIPGADMDILKQQQARSAEPLSSTARHYALAALVQQTFKKLTHGTVIIKDSQ